MEKEEIIKEVLKRNNFRNLNPVQQKAIEMGILDGENLVVSSPTSSGKTLLAEIAGLNVTFNKHKKMIYLCPLVALAREKYEEFKRKYGDWGIRVALSVGNYDSSDPWLKNFDWIVLSNEKMDSLIRHEADWIEEIGLIVADEIHLLADFQRGPTLEILLTLLKEMLPQAQLLAFSATISNAQEIGDWLGASLLKSNFRPVPLYKGIASEEMIHIFNFKKYQLSRNLPLEEAILENTLLMKKQLIFFVSSRRNAESLAQRLSTISFHFLSDEELKELEKISKAIENALEIPTGQCKKLSSCVKNGVAFYHSGLLLRQRILVEEAYKKGIIKTIVSTTALAAGINLPNFRAVIRDVKRYSPGLGSIFVPVLEVEQMFGRSGRPQYDQWGEGILLTKKKGDEEELKRLYIHGELEEIVSQISSESALRVHLLSLTSNRICKTQNELIDFFQKTFFGQKYELSFLKEKIEETLETLREWGFLELKDKRENGKKEDKVIFPTKIGKRISQLYIDPLTAHIFIENLKDCKKASEFTLLCLLAQSQELKPSPILTLNDSSLVEGEIRKNEEFFFFQIPDELDEDYEEFLREAKLATIFSFWIEEVSEKEIVENFKITPGELYSRREILDWLLYAVLEMTKFFEINKEIKRMLMKLRKRIKYGIKEELIPLVFLEGIGRVRARNLFDAGFKTIEQLKNAPLNQIAEILKNKTLAEKIKTQLK